MCFGFTHICQMDLGFPFLYLVCIVMLNAHGPARGSDVEQINCACLEIPTRPLTEPQPGTCFQKGSRFRYKCVDGYVRRAGTSDLTRCTTADDSSQGTWSTPSLECIPDPRKPQPEINPTVQTAASTRQQMTQSSLPPTTVAAETNSTDPSYLISDQSHAKATEREEDNKTSTLTTASPSDNSTADPLVLSKQSSRTAASATCAALAIVCAVIGISFWCYKRRSKDNTQTPPSEELTHMNPSQPEPPI